MIFKIINKHNIIYIFFLLLFCWVIFIIICFGIFLLNLYLKILDIELGRTIEKIMKITNLDKGVFLIFTMEIDKVLLEKGFYPQEIG